MKNQKVFDDLKFRIGYGVSGNSLGFDAYTAQQTYGASGWFTYVDPVTGSSSSYRTWSTKNANPDLKWERTACLCLAITSILQQPTDRTHRMEKSIEKEPYHFPKNDIWTASHRLRNTTLLVDFPHATLLKSYNGQQICLETRPR